MERTIKSKETFYNGTMFKSALEARWAVFFDNIGVDWEYEPEQFSLESPGYSIVYTPDFRLNNVRFRCDVHGRRDVYVEVKGVPRYMDMYASDRVKIERFAEEYAIIVLGNIPMATDKGVYDYQDTGLSSFEFIDGDQYPCFFSVYKGEVWLAGPDHEEGLFNAAPKDADIVMKALATASMARFDYSNIPQ